MSWIDRYVQEVARHLPKDRREDVAREQRSTLLDAAEDRFGGSATEAQVLELLAEQESPASLAATYRPTGAYLIGPGWYPTFTRVLRIVLSAFAGALVLAFALRILFAGGGADLGAQLVGLLAAIVKGALFASAVIVGIFVLLERSASEPPPAEEPWDPLTLPPAHDRAVVGRGEAAFSIVLPAAFLAVAHLFRDQIGLRVDDGPLLFNQLVVDYLPWLTIAVLLGMAVHAALFWQGHWRWYTRAADFASDLFALGVIYRFCVALLAESERLAGTALPEILARMIGQAALGVPAVVALVLVLQHGSVALRSLRALGGAGSA